ncbi:DUF6809 family protein [uncultured Intestinimonas sp.]|uniref:DUF6809 family protein n=1 Tax=uncultured Intestinimonas sp. TaxID=1689265 RepID=UPI0025E58A61|nr:DUF6809 family protein [uncultured Intestinimonas sp.]
MRTTLEDLYYGSLTPWDRDIVPGSDLAEALDRAEGCEAALTTRLEGDEKVLLLALVSTQNEVESSLVLENFILGFRLGMRLAVEGLDREDGSLTDGEGR